jgi:hypothetical protein
MPPLYEASETMDTSVCILVVDDELSIREGCWRGATGCTTGRAGVLDKEHLVCYNFLGWDAAMTLGLEEDMSTILRRHLTHKVFAKAMPSVWVSRADRAHWPFARPFFIYADKES